MIDVRKYQKADKIIWDNFIDQSKNSTFLFKRDFMDYHQDRFEDYSLMVFDKNTLLAIFPAHKVDDHSIASHLGLTYGGLIVHKNEILLKTLRIVYEMLEFLNNDRIEKLLYKAIPRFYNTIGSDEVDFALFLLAAKLTKRDMTIAINLKDRLPMHKLRSRGVIKAKKLGVVVREVQCFKSFWNDILIPNLKNKFDTDPVHSVEEITLLRHAFPSNIRQFNAYLNDTIVAGATIFETKKVAHVQYNSNNLEGRNTGASDLLYSHLIDEYSLDKNYFDFGISSDHNGLNHGLLSWKEGFGGRSFSCDFYEIETKNYVNLNEETSD
jgi:hypothetical protein